VTNADLIVATLRAAGIEHGFGVPSGNVLPLMDAMRRGGIEFVLTAHEGSAGFAADVCARMSGTPGLAIATLGPGATNLATGVGNAYLDRSPMIAITCNLHQHQLGRRIQMYIDHGQLFAPITKASFMLSAGSVGDTVAKAVELATTEPYGPVHLDLPEDIALAPTDEPLLIPSRGTALDPAGAAQVRHLFDAIRSAEHPIAIVGASALRMSCHELITELVELLEIPFFTTTMAKGLVDDRHPLALGCIERALRQRQRTMAQRADLIVGIGYDTIEVEYEAWVGSVPVAQIDIETVDVDDSVNVVAECIGDLDANLTALLGLARSEAGAGSRWLTEDISEHRDRFQTDLRPASSEFCPHQAIDVVRDMLPDDGILTFDVGAHTHQIASQWTATRPRSFLITNGWSSMGFGLPAAIAAKLSAPEHPVVCILGDGCFQMTCGELATMSRLGLTVPVVVLDDRWLSLIKVKQERRQLARYGTELQSEPYGEPPAHYFGVPAFGVADAVSLAAELERAFRRSGPTVIEAKVDPAHYSQTVFD
jgi:acetolactate synthase-1/2/3 large subunit